MLTLGLTLVLLAEPSARLLTEADVALSAEEITALDREVRILNAHIQELKPRIPTGFAVGMAIGFSFSVLLLPGVPLLIAGSVGSLASGVLFIGGFLSGLGALGLVSALICLVMGNNAESDMADERAQLVERRDAIRARLPRPTAPEAPRPPPIPQYVPGVQRDLPSPPLLTVARF